MNCGAAALSSSARDADMPDFSFNIDSIEDVQGTSGGCAAPTRSPAPWGVKSAIGERQSMEDTWSVQLPLCSNNQELVPGASSGRETEASCIAYEDLTFFAVYDGHGGSEVAQFCADNLHKRFAEQLSSSNNKGPRTHNAETQANGAHAHASQAVQGQPGPSPTPDALTQQGASVSSPECADQSSSTSGNHAFCPDADAQCTDSKEIVSSALRTAFQLTDSALQGTETGDYVGATAVVAVLGKTHIWIAHCGDSRAVIQRKGEATPLTKDHRPDREDEAARVRAAGGRIVFNSGSYRVMGMLAMSRAIGDHFLRPYVIAEPEVTVMERVSEDEVLIIATDGLWDVFTCKEATSLAHRCIARSKDRGMSRYGGCRVAASVLTKVAMERGSRDNITVIVVDITHNAEHSPTQDASELPVPSSTQVEEGSSSRGDGEASGAGVLSGSGGGIAVGAVVQLKGRSERASMDRRDSDPAQHDQLEQHSPQASQGAQPQPICELRPLQPEPGPHASQRQEVQQDACPSPANSLPGQGQVRAAGTRTQACFCTEPAQCSCGFGRGSDADQGANVQRFVSLADHWLPLTPLASDRPSQQTPESAPQAPGTAPQALGTALQALAAPDSGEFIFQLLPPPMPAWACEQGVYGGIPAGGFSSMLQPQPSLHGDGSGNESLRGSGLSAGSAKRRMEQQRDGLNLPEQRGSQTSANAEERGGSSAGSDTDTGGVKRKRSASSCQLEVARSHSYGSAQAGLGLGLAGSLGVVQAGGSPWTCLTTPVKM